MGYRRATWHSGLTYAQTCPKCNTNVKYTDDKLGFRAWHADGFIYCPTCKTVLAHSEDYAIDKPAQPTTVDMTAKAAFCTGCGTPFKEGANFCTGCGKKR